MAHERTHLPRSALAIEGHAPDGNMNEPISNGKFCTTFAMLAKVVTSQTRKANLSRDPTPASWVRDFTWMNLPEFFRTKAN